MVLPTVAVTAKVAVASKADGPPGKFKFARTGDTSAALSVGYKILGASSAVFGTDYTLIDKGSALGKNGTVTIPAGKASVIIKIVPVQSTTPAPATTVFLKLKQSDSYSPGQPRRVVVQVTATGAGQ